VGTNKGDKMDIEFEDINRLKIYSDPLVFKYTVYLNDIVEPEYFSDLFHKLRNCNPDDVFEIVINSYGGNEDTAIQLYNELRSCLGNVVGVVSGYCCSAGTIALLACSGWAINKNSKIMIHSPSGFMGGKSHERKAQGDFEEKWTHEFFRDVYKDFLTTKEIQEVLDGKDMWMTGDDAIKRLEKLAKVRGGK
jgi:ATP-dependent Clp protease, protease subunit